MKKSIFELLHLADHKTSTKILKKLLRQMRKTQAVMRKQLKQFRLLAETHPLLKPISEEEREKRAERMRFLKAARHRKSDLKKCSGIGLDDPTEQKA